MKLHKSLIAVALIVTACGTTTAQNATGESPKERLAKAEAMFQERCKTAGEKITRTVDNVEGIYLLKLRPAGINYGAQFAMDDPYGRDLGGEGYIGTFIRGKYQAETIAPSAPVPGAPPRLGYRYVEALDPADGKRYRYTGSMKEVSRKSSILIGGDGKTYTGMAFVLDKIPAPGEPPRYGVTYDDISTHEEREYWIDGSSLKVIDLKTNEVIAERVGYMMDRGQGDKGRWEVAVVVCGGSCLSEFPSKPNDSFDWTCFCSSASSNPRFRRESPSPRSGEMK